jgi:hypothetical protein
VGDVLSGGLPASPARAPEGGHARLRVRTSMHRGAGVEVSLIFAEAERQNHLYFIHNSSLSA